jgi:hypothetical protein
MRKLVILFSAVLLFLSFSETKALDTFWFNWYATSSVGQLMPNESGTLNVRVYIQQGATTVYQEVHTGISTDQFAIFSINVGAGTPEGGPWNFGTIAVTAATRIRADVQKSPAAYITQMTAGLTSVQVNNTILPGNINLAQNKILIGNAAGDAEAQPVGGDMTGTNTGSAASLTINNNAVTSSKIASNAVTTAKIMDVNVTYAKFQNATNPGRILVSNGAGNTWVEATPSSLETDPVWTLAEPNYGNLAQGETISGDWVNTANPWADNEVANNLTITGGTITNTPISGSTGSFSTLAASSTVTFSGLTAGNYPEALVVDNTGVVYKSPNQGSYTNIVDKNANYSATSADGTILVDCTAGSRIITLPAAATNKGLKISIKKVDASGNSMVVNSAGGNIDGVASKTTIVPNQGYIFQSNGTNWYVVGIF